MNLTEWRTAVKEQASRLRGRLSDLVHQTEQLAPGVIYGATAALSVAPLVASAQSGAVLIVELAALLGGLGANLLSNELYAWKQRSEEQLSAELPARLGELALSNPDWRDLLDKLVQETQAASAAQTALGEAAGAYLAALQADAQRVGSHIIVASVGDNAKNVLIGNDSTLIVHETHYHGPQPPITFDDILRSYLAKERRLCDELPLAKPKADARRVPRMQRIFVELRTTLPVDEATWFDRLGVAAEKRYGLRRQLARRGEGGADAKQRQAGATQTIDPNWFAELHHLDDKKLAPIAKTLGVTPAQVQAARHPFTPLEHLRTLSSQGQPAHLVLLGDPGGGKSTWVRRLTSVLAWRRLADGDAALESLTDEEAAWLLAAQRGLGEEVAPIRIAMHRWASLVRRGELKLTGAAADLVAVCAHTIRDTHDLEAIGIYKHTLKLLKDGEAVILLDGLDEVADDAQRTRMIAAVRAFASETTYHSMPLLITCRSKPYARLQSRDQAVLPDDHVCTLGPLDDDAIDLFIERWYAEMTWAERGEPGKLQADARRLQAALPVRPDLQHMARTPLLLTMMARTNQESGLPDGRAELYENLVQELLWEWEVRRTYGEVGIDQPPPDAGAEQPLDNRSLLEILRAANLGLSQPDLEKVLNQLAYDVHAGMQGGEVEIDRGTLETYFARLLPCALDDGKGKARAAELATNVVNFIGQRTGLLVDIEDGQRFRFTHYTFQEYLAARWIAFGNNADCLSKLDQRIADVHWREAIFLALGYMISEVRKAYDDAILLVEDLIDRPLHSAADLQRLLLVGEAYVRQFTPDKLRRAYNEARSAKVTGLVAERLRQAMQERTLAPAARLEAGLLLDDLRTQHGLTPDGLDAFIPVPGADFAISKYPVTNRQFRRFVDAGGYGEAERERPAWWSDQGWEQRLKYDWATPRYWDDRKWNRETQPVVGVSWYEAEAYCRWLNLTAEGQHHKPTDMKAQLPTQEQWMLAARNGQAAPAKEAEDYPWRAPFDKALANTEESSLQQTTPVDMYPDGATPTGVCDLAGNVWEWTVDAYNKERTRFWVKGGSWAYSAERARASAADSWSFDWHWFDGDGFRCVCVPDLS